MRIVYIMIATVAQKLFLEFLTAWDFSDGAASQYKNRKNFHHKDDFGMSGIFRPDHTTATPRQLACTNIAAHFGYCSNEDYQREEQNLEKRFQKSRTIPVLESCIPSFLRSCLKHAPK